MSSDSTHSISKSLSILSSFQNDTIAQSTSEIASKLNISTSTASRHLNILLDEGFLLRDDSTGLYSLGHKILTLAGVMLSSNSFYQSCSMEFPKITHQFQVNCHLGIPVENSIFHLFSSSCENVSDLIEPIGGSYPMYCSALGRAILAFVPNEQAKKILSSCTYTKYTSRTELDIEKILEQLEQIRINGYAENNEEMVNCITGLAVPILNSQKEPVAAIGMTLNSNQLTNLEKKDELLRTLFSTATKMSNKIGYRPW